VQSAGTEGDQSIVGSPLATPMPIGDDWLAPELFRFSTVRVLMQIVKTVDGNFTGGLFFTSLRIP
jgi:hypothetical protein